MFHRPMVSLSAFVAGMAAALRMAGPPIPFANSIAPAPRRKYHSGVRVVTGQSVNSLRRAINAGDYHPPEALLTHKAKMRHAWYRKQVAEAL